MLKLKAPDDMTGSIGFDGQQYSIDSDGIVEVPDEAAGPLADHGFVPAETVERRARGKGKG